MNREILFRGKRTDNGEWVKGWLIKDEYGICIASDDALYHVDGNEWNFEDVEVNPETVGQYTGLTDKNGVKIFEGDILKWDEKEWGCPFFETVTWNYELFEIRQREWKSFCEVVGNIFDNPELLEENNT